jgi:uncharacterized damage-inducible protein DinB
MTDIERKRVIEYLESTRSRLLKTVEDFPEERFATDPAEGCWSAAKTMEHIVFVEGRALGRIHGALQQPPDASRKSGMAGRDEELWNGVTNRAQKVDAPSIAHPAGRQSREELVTAFQSAREMTLIFARSTDAELRHHFAAHPMFGELDCFQWLMLIPSHGERHRAQIEECQEKLRAS